MIYALVSWFEQVLAQLVFRVAILAAAAKLLDKKGFLGYTICMRRSSSVG